MNKYYLLAGLITLVFLGAGCQPKPGDDLAKDAVLELYSCQTDADCMPKPGCHPMECINNQFEDEFAKPEFCTMEYNCSAAYNQTDCLCQNGKCINDKIKNPDPSCS